jgi:hypothetical protein
MLVSSVAASSTATTVIGPDPFPNGRVIRITVLGAADPGDGDGIASVVSLRWGSPGNWRTLRSLANTGTSWECVCRFVLTGDGVKRLELRSQNRSVSAKNIFAWADIDTSE